MEHTGSIGTQRRRHRRSLVFVSFAGLAAVAVALPAQGARVVDVRLGQHEGYSRVVFELDAPVGYKVERHTPPGGGSQLVVSLDAAAQPRKLSPKLDYVGGIDIQSDGRRSTVHIDLVGSGLKLKEMILASPPRIVLDLLSADAASKKKPARAAKAPAAKQTKPTAQAKPAPQQTTATTGAKPQPAPTSAKTEPAEKQMRGSVVVAPPPASIADAGPDGPSPTTKLAMNKSTPPPAGQPGPAPSAARETPPLAGPARPAPKPAATARPSVAPKAPAAAPAPVDEGLLTTQNLMIAGLGVLLLVGVGVIWRRRNAAEVMDASEFEAVGDDDNPFASLDEDEGGVMEAPLFEDDPESTDAPLAESEGADMSMDMVTDGPAAKMSAPMGASAAGGDVARMIAEFERRIAGMESRIDELVDAKERLERQVAAQTEELRVQRAAIARTQRAVRNMNRAGDDSPTEPALRDPTRPEGPRE